MNMFINGLNNNVNNAFVSASSVFRCVYQTINEATQDNVNRLVCHLVYDKVTSLLAFFLSLLPTLACLTMHQCGHVIDHMHRCNDWPTTLINLYHVKHNGLRDKVHCLSSHLIMVSQSIDNNFGISGRF